MLEPFLLKTLGRLLLQHENIALVTNKEWQELPMICKLMKIDESILKKPDELITKTLLYGDYKFDLSCNKSIISSTIEFIVSAERFSNSLPSE